MGSWTLVRHGQSLANLEGWFAGHKDAPLTLQGRQEALATREVLGTAEFTHAYTSDLSRARETAEIILSGRATPLHVTPVLRERYCGQWEGRAIADVERCGDFDILRSFDRSPPEGESLRTVASRVLGFIRVHNHGSHNLLVGHGAVMRAVIGVVDGLPTDQIGLWRPKNCEIVHRQLDGKELQRCLASLM